MDDLLLLQQIQRTEHLLRKAPNHLEREATEGVGLDEFVQVHIQKFCRNAEMIAEVEAVSKVDHAVLVVRVL